LTNRQISLEILSYVDSKAAQVHYKIAQCHLRMAKLGFCLSGTYAGLNCAKLGRTASSVCSRRRIYGSRARRQAEEVLQEAKAQLNCDPAGC